MRILHVLDHSLPLHSGYTFRTRAILKAQVARGWTVAGVTGARHAGNGVDKDHDAYVAECRESWISGNMDCSRAQTPELRTDAVPQRPRAFARRNF